MGGFTKMMLIGEGVQVTAHSCCVRETFPLNPNSRIQKSYCSNTFPNFCGGSLAVVFRRSALTPRAQIPKNHSLLQTKRRRRFTPGVRQHCCLCVGSGCREPRVSTSAP